MLYMFIGVFVCGESIPVVGFSCKSMGFFYYHNCQLRSIKSKSEPKFSRFRDIFGLLHGWYAL